MPQPLEAHLHRQLDHSRTFFWHRLRWQAVKELLPTDRPFELVDVGAGAGLLGEYLLRDFPQARYRFVEPIESLEQLLVERFGADANARDETTYTGAEFVTLLDVLEHQRDDLEFMTDVVGRLQPGATLVVTVPALMRLWSQWDVALGHYKRYDKQSLRALAAQLPVEVRELSYLFPEMVPPALVRRRQRSSERDNAESAEFPDLPPRLNELLYRVGRVSLMGRRRWPAGTSLLATLQRT